MQQTLVAPLDADNVDSVCEGRPHNRPNGRVDVMLKEQDGFAVISVIDTGCGMAPGEQANLFERGYRTASARRSGVQGSGLGLYFAHSIAEAHEGTIEVNSSPGEGTCVWVFLPLRSKVVDFPTALGARAGSIH